MCLFYTVIGMCIRFKPLIQFFNLRGCQPHPSLYCIVLDSEKKLSKIQNTVDTTSPRNIHKDTSVAKYNIRIIGRWAAQKTHRAQHLVQSVQMSAVL